MYALIWRVAMNTRKLVSSAKLSKRSVPNMPPSSRTPWIPGGNMYPHMVESSCAIHCHNVMS